MTTAREDDTIDAEVVDAPTAEVVQLHKTPTPTQPTPLEVDRALSEFGSTIARITDKPLPSRHQITVATRWWLQRIVRLIPWIPILAFRELRPILRGVGKVTAGWSNWAAAAKDHEYAKLGEGNTAAKLGAGASKKSSARAVGSVVGVLAWSAGWIWLWLTHPSWAFLGVVVVVAGLDMLGRQGVVTEPFLPPVALPSVLGSNVPLGQITQTILAVFEREGFEEGSVRVATPLAWDEQRSEYRIGLSVADGIRPEHLRAIERGVGARDHSVRSLATDTATVREIVIRVGDPLAVLAERPFIPTGTRSIVETVSLGESITEVPFAIPFAGVHVRIVMGTGGGKTKWVLRSAIDGLSACRDCVLGGIDITNGPELSLWRGVIQHRGLNVEDAERVLDLALAEIDRRGQILTAIAEDDDPDNDADEWHTGLGPALVIFVDEFAQLAVFDGKGGKPNLLGKCEQIVRTGRKHWVSLVMLTQKTGNDDFGSTTMSTQCAVSIAGPCDPADAVRMFGVERRDAGYTPHMLAPGVEGDIRDAGKVFIDSPMHRSADLYRAYAPGTTAEVKRRARQRLADGLPTLHGGRADTVDAVEVPPIPAAVARAFAECDAEKLPTTVLISFLEEAGISVTDQQLSDAMRIGEERIGDRWREVPGGPQVRGYTRSAVERHLRSLG